MVKNRSTDWVHGLWPWTEAIFVHMEGFYGGSPKVAGLQGKIPIKMDDSGVTPLLGNLQIKKCRFNRKIMFHAVRGRMAVYKQQHMMSEKSYPWIRVRERNPLKSRFCRADHWRFEFQERFEPPWASGDLRCQPVSQSRRGKNSTTAHGTASSNSRAGVPTAGRSVDGFGCCSIDLSRNYGFVSKKGFNYTYIACWVKEPCLLSTTKARCRFVTILIRSEHWLTCLM